MYFTLLMISGGMLAIGLIFNLISWRYRTAEFIAIPWYRRMHFAWELTKCYNPPGHIFAYIGMALMSSGALIYLVITLLKD